MNELEINVENKIHISLPESVFLVLDNDMFSFDVEKKATFINKVISHFYGFAKSSIPISIENKRQYYYDILDSKCNSLSAKDRENVISALMNAYEQELIPQEKNKQARKSFKFRLNNKNMEYLNDNCEYLKYYSSLGKYLAAIIEEYSSLPYYERERIYYRNYFSILEDAILSQKIVEIKIALPSNQSKKISIKPYSIMKNELSMYHYLIGLADLSEDGKFVPFSYRIARLTSEPKKTEQKSFISAQNIKHIESKIAEQGVMFLDSECEQICIYLTDEGIEKYKRIANLRPAYMKIDEQDKHIYYFSCSRRQISFYFSRFCKDAVIISPLDLHDSFLQNYKDAVNNYCNINL